MKDNRVSIFSLNRRFFAADFVIFFTLLGFYALLVFLEAPSVSHESSIKTLIYVVEHTSRAVPIAIVVVLLIEGVIYTMLYAIELARAKGEQLRQKTRERIKDEVKNEIYQDYRQFEENLRNWNEQRIKAQQDGVDFNEPMPILADHTSPIAFIKSVQISIDNKSILEKDIHELQIFIYENRLLDATHRMLEQKTNNEWIYIDAASPTFAQGKFQSYRFANSDSQICSVQIGYIPFPQDEFFQQQIGSVVDSIDF